VSFLRTLSTRRLLLLVAAVAVLAVGGAAIAMAATGSSGPTPPPKPLDQAIHDALSAPEPAGITARIKFTNRLFPSGALLGGAADPLMSGASGRLWINNDGGRLELQSDVGDAQIVWSKTEVTVFDASSNTVYHATLPPEQDQQQPETVPSLEQIGTFLSDLGAKATISDARPDNVAGQPAYTVTVSPKHDGGLLGSAQLAWDAAQGVPLRVAIYAQGSSEPVLELEATDISYESVPDSDIQISPPDGARVVDLGTLSRDHGTGGESQASGLDAVQAATDFPVVAPDTLVGLPRQDVRLVGDSDSKSVLVVYGQGLGAIIVVERKATDSGQTNGFLSNLPSVALDGVSGHELATQLGTVVTWQRDGVAYVLAGSLPPAAAEAAARDLK
jgi:outer membrane lipoprotein-sorting protein